MPRPKSKHYRQDKRSNKDGAGAVDGEEDDILAAMDDETGALDASSRMKLNVPQTNAQFESCVNKKGLNSFLLPLHN